MKIELKHLAGYLPYGVKVKWNNTSYEMISLRLNERCQLVDYYTEEVYGVKLEHIKPILRPLSDLTKEIEVNGEKFVPIEIIDKRNNLSVLETTKDTDLIDCLPYWVINYFLEWHFDIYGLIENGLAIDINTL